MWIVLIYVFVTPSIVPTYLQFSSLPIRFYSEAECVDYLKEHKDSIVETGKVIGNYVLGPPYDVFDITMTCIEDFYGTVI